MDTEKYRVTMDSNFAGERKAVGDLVDLDEEQARIRLADGHVEPAPKVSTRKAPGS